MLMVLDDAAVLEPICCTDGSSWGDVGRLPPPPPGNTESGIVTTVGEPSSM